MKLSSNLRRSVVFTSLFLLCFSSVLAQEPTNGKNDPERKVVQTIADQAKAEIEKFEKSASAKSGEHPAKKWASELWKYHDFHSGTPAGSLAVREALQLLYAAGMVEELCERAWALPPEDRAWDYAIGILYMIHVNQFRQQNGAARFTEKAEALLETMNDPGNRAAVLLRLGYVYEDAVKQRAAYERAVKEAPQSSAGTKAERMLYEMDFLQPGKPLPAFEVTATDGTLISTSNLKGRTAVFIFWSTG